MRKIIIYSLFLCFAIGILSPISIFAASNMGTIKVQVGKDASAGVEAGGGYSYAGQWSREGDAFQITARSYSTTKISCTITGRKVGTAKLWWKGTVNARYEELYWEVNVTNSTPNPDPDPDDLTLTADPAGGNVEKGTKVTLTASNKNAIVCYTLDGSDPHTSSTKHLKSSGDYVTINETCTLKAYAEYIIHSKDYTWNFTVNESNTPTIEINSTNFPDANFRNYLLEQDYGEDGIITGDEINSITRLDVFRKNISDLTGIEHFTALTYLDSGSNLLSAIDISKNTALRILYCNYNQLTSLDISRNTSLAYLDCGSNQLTSIDVSKNTVLKTLNCNGNKLTSLNLSENRSLESLNCSYNQLTSLDLSKNTVMTKLICYSNQLTSLNVLGNTALTFLNCYDNQIQGEAMDAVIKGLPKNTTNDNYEFYVISDPTDDGNVCTTAQVAAAKNKGWIPMYNNTLNIGTAWREYAGSDPTGINGVETSEKKVAPIFDLSGQQMKKPRKGINIIGGKKVLVK